MKGVYGVTSTWSDDQSTPADIAACMVATLDRLARIGPTPHEWRLIDLGFDVPLPDEPGFDEFIANIPSILAQHPELEEGVPIEELRSNGARFVERGVARGDYGVPTPVNGYSVQAQNQKPSQDDQPSKLWSVDARVGNKRESAIHFKIGEGDELPPIDDSSYDVFRSVLETISISWPSPWASAFFCNYESELSPYEPILGPDDFEAWLREEASNPADFANPRIEWIGYLSAPLAKGLKPPSALIAESTAGGGMILSVTKDRLDPHNPDHRRGAAILGQVLNQCGAGWGDRNARPPRIRTGPF